MSAKASQIIVIGNATVCPITCLGSQQIKHQSSLAVGKRNPPVTGMVNRTETMNERMYET